MRRTPQLFLLLLVYLVYSMTTTPSHAFPSMLVDSNSGCLLELSSEEVIMNNRVVPHSESSRPDLYVAVIGSKDGTNDELSTTPFSRGPILISSENDKTLTYLVKLINPGQDIPDLQYAMETTDGATFKGGGCNGKRSHGRLQDDVGLELTIHSTKNEIRVWAGWATNHEAVHLTQELVFTPAAAAAANTNKEEATGTDKLEVVPTKSDALPKTTEEEAVPGTTSSAADEAHKEA